MLSYVSQFVGRAKQQQIESLAEDVLHVADFQVEHPFEDYQFFPMGIDGYDHVFITQDFLPEENLSRPAAQRTLSVQGQKVVVKLSTKGIPKERDQAIYRSADMIRRLDPDVVGEEFARMYQQFELAARRVRR